MSERILEHLEHAANGIGLVAVAVIVGGFCVAAVRYLLRYRRASPDDNFEAFRLELGRALTLGLEILVLAIVIKTINAEPTIEVLGHLALLVVVRTAVAWTLSLEIEGRWPWQPPVDDGGGEDRA